MTDAAYLDTPFRALFELSPDAILVFVQGLVRHANPAALQLLRATRLEEVVGRASRDLIAPECLEVVARNAEALMNGTATSTWCEEIYIRLDGSRVEVEATAARATYIDGKAFVVILRDISERREAAARVVREQERRDLERQMSNSQRLEAIGRLAGGVAHDFNNLLTVILESADHLGQLAVDAEGDLDRIRKAATRAASLTRGLLAFAREAPVQARLTVVDEQVSRLVTMLVRVLGDDVRVVTDLRAEGASAMLDAGQLDLVVVNLALNARDAMPDGGTLSLATRTGAEPMKPGEASTPCISIEVTDTGFGMDEVTRQRAFEPFFTTKAPGSGSGLGLSTSYGIITQLGGRMELRSSPGRGTTVRILVPRSGGAGAEDRGTRVASASSTVLLVEDEPDVRRATARMLRTMGYAVLVADDAVHALTLTRDYVGTIDALVTDVVMPDMNGVEVARRFGALRTSAGLVLMSGYSRDSLPGAEGLPVRHLGKPFTRAELSAALDEAMAARAPSHRTGVE